MCTVRIATRVANHDSGMAAQTSSANALNRSLIVAAYRFAYPTNDQR